MSQTLIGAPIGHPALGDLCRRNLPALQSLQVLRDRAPLFVTLSDGSIRNTYDIRLRNKLGEARDFAITVTAEDDHGAPDLALRIEDSDDNVVSVPANETLSTRVYLEAPADSHAAQEGRTGIRLWVADDNGATRVHHDTVFNGKGD